MLGVVRLDKCISKGGCAALGGALWVLGYGTYDSRLGACGSGSVSPTYPGYRSVLTLLLAADR
jgi:hypothetical protein